LSFFPRTRIDDAVLPDELPRFSQVGGGGGGLTFAAIVKPADEIVNNSSTLQDDNDLTFAVNANKTYMLFLMMIVNSNVTPDFKYAWTVPSGATIIKGVDFAIYFRGEAVSGDFATDATVATTIGTVGSNRLYGFIFMAEVGATPGNITLQWAQDVANASDTIMLQGSTVLVWQD